MGLSIHYRGALTDKRAVYQLIDEVEDIASAPPTASPIRQSKLSSQVINMTITMLMITCKVPNPNTIRFIVTNLDKLNSSPILNIKKTTPNSARWRVSSLSGIQPKACGPMRTPESKYPSMGGRRSSLKMTTAITAIDNKISTGNSESVMSSN